MKTKKTFIVKKRPAEVMVDFAQNDGKILTLEGEVSFKKGDAIITGTQGEKWPVGRTIFFKHYAPSKNHEMGESGIYESIPRELKAWKLTKPIQIKLSDNRGVLKGNVGDWIIAYDDKDFGVVQADIFPLTYEIMSQDANDNQ